MKRPTQLLRLPLALSLGASLFLFSCGSMAVFDNSMSPDEHNALVCQANLEQLTILQGSEGRIGEGMIEHGPKCPVDGSSYEASLKAADGKLASQAEVICGGEHHKAAGYPADYPRHVPGKGVIANPEGTVKVPACMGLPLPEKAVVVGTGASGGSVSVTFTTDEPLEQLATRYYKVLNNGQDPVLSTRLVDSGVMGKLGGLPYAMTFDEREGKVMVSWEPPIMAKKS